MRQSPICGICLMESSRIPADNDMLETQTCPVCGMENISRDADRCPQCDADMTCFKVLDTLPDEIKPHSGMQGSPAFAKKEFLHSGMRNFMPAVMMLLTVLIILLTLFQFYRFRKLETMVANQKTELTKSLHGLMNEVRETGNEQKTDSEAKSVTPAGESLVGNAQPEPDKAKTEVSQPATDTKETPPPKPEPLPESEFWTYNAGDGDTLWDIAEMYYGSGHYYPVLLEHNPNICVYEIGYGVRLKILRNPRVARQIYRKIIVKEKDHLYWYYTIAEGDTFRSVINKFYRIKDVEKHLSENNPDAELQPGKRIRILLQ